MYSYYLNLLILCAIKTLDFGLLFLSYHLDMQSIHAIIFSMKKGLKQT